MKKQQILQASELGKQAFLSGATSAPYADPSLMKMLAGRNIGEAPKGQANSEQIMKAWIGAWTRENLKTA